MKYKEDTTTMRGSIMTNTKTLAKLGEKAALNFLEAKDYEIQDRDDDIIISVIDGILCFQVVRTRQNCFADEASVSRNRLESFAGEYLSCHDFTDMPIRFDVIDINVLDNGKAIIRHHVSAFGDPCEAFSVSKNNELQLLLEELQQNGDISQDIANKILSAVA